MILEITELMKRIDNPDPRWFTRSTIRYFWIPTEVVVEKPEFFTPVQGRYYQLDLYVREKFLVSYDELRKMGNFNGVSHETQVHLYEIWADHGDDGHTEYDLMCWMLHAGKYEGGPLHRMHNDLYDIFHPRN